MQARMPGKVLDDITTICINNGNLVRTWLKVKLRPADTGQGRSEADRSKPHRVVLSAVGLRRTTCAQR